MDKNRFFKTGVAVVLVSMCVLVFCASCFIVGLSDEYDNVKAPEILANTEVFLDPDDLARLHTIPDWQLEFSEMLREFGWEHSPYPVTVVSVVSCQEPTRLSALRMDFQAIEYSGLIPFKKYAIASYDQETHRVSIRIEEQALRLKRARELDLAQYKVDFAGAIEIADLNGGGQYQQELDQECLVTGLLQDNLWKVIYSPVGSTTGPELIIEIDPVSGTVKHS
ncbi:MAG: hypothetical protein KDH90_14570 [Anaerolineae bacterium]|nr:hypothetical protein [Anaerolineae bacterium]MCO5245045.1 hypothetical protein [Anaerolineae bacterium]